MTTTDYGRLAHLQKVDQPTGQALNLGQPGDTANCTRCPERVIYGAPLDGDTGGWMHIRSLDPTTLAPIHHDHPAQPDAASLEGAPK